MNTSSRYLIGIDLGTTNCAVAYVDTSTLGRDGPAHIGLFRIPQVVAPGQVEPRELLPSFLYLPGPELPGGAVRLPWDTGRDYAVGEFARNQGAAVPTRMVASAKSWLCHAGIDRRSPVLPFSAPAEVPKVSPVEASARYLRHMAESWNQQMTDGSDANRFEQQDIYLTVPASFDAIARELTVEAARSAGLENITLLEEPTAAFYSWLHSAGDDWRKRVSVGDLILVCDIGGGTTDLSLIAVTEEAGNLALTRIAVGDHILLGGDNMDIALAFEVSQRLSAKGHKNLDAWQSRGLQYACRAAKEKLFSNADMTAHPVTLLGRGSSVIGGSIKTELLRSDLEAALLAGFFPQCAVSDDPKRARTVGFQELGLPYAKDPAVTKYMGVFLRDNLRALAKAGLSVPEGRSFAHPTGLLFNGGVLKAEPLRRRLVDVLNAWTAAEGGKPVKELAGVDLDLAVARGASYYGLVRRGKGVRVRGGTVRAYYVGVESAMPAVPGHPPPMKAVCVAPFGMEEGTTTDIPGSEFGLVVGEPVHFPFLGSNVRRDDKPGAILDNWGDDEVAHIAAVDAALDPQAGQDRGIAVPVKLQTRVTEIGTLELYCVSRDGQHRWRLEFNVRDKD